MKFLFPFFCWILLLFSCQKTTTETSHSDPPDLFENPPIIIAQDGAEIQQYWEGRYEQEALINQLGDFSALKAFRDSVVQAIGQSTLEAIVNRDTIQLTPWPEENENHLLVHNGEVGSIQNLSFLEAYLLNYQLSRYPLFSHPTEFGSPILIHESLNKMRVYFAASDQPWPPKAPELTQHMKQALQEGWKLHTHLHNHYEPDSNLYLGIMAPSLSDVHFLKNWRDAYGLDVVRITNGFTTLHLPSDQLDSLKSH